MNTIRSLSTSSLRQLSENASQDQQMLHVVLQALVQLGDQLNAMEQRQQRIEGDLQYLRVHMR